MKHRFIYWMWGIYVSILVLCVGFIACVKMGWIGYMPQLDELQNPINRFASQIFSADGNIIYNPTLYSIWVDIDKKVYEIKSGETIKL